jgi:hypothetical protein
MVLLIRGRCAPAEAFLPRGVRGTPVVFNGCKRMDEFPSRIPRKSGGKMARFLLQFGDVRLGLRTETLYGVKELIFHPGTTTIRLEKDDAQLFPGCVCDRSCPMLGSSFQGTKRRDKVML